MNITERQAGMSCKVDAHWDGHIHDTKLQQSILLSLKKTYFLKKFDVIQSLTD